MRKIIAIHHVSLDGVVQAPGGPEEDPRGGFPYGGWSATYGDESSGEVLSEIMSGQFDLLLGRRTYEIFSAYWPYTGENFIANAFNKATKYVVTRTLKEPTWVNSKLIGASSAVEDVRKLKESDGPELHIWGSGNLLQTLIAADLVDEFRMWVYPVILGQGKRLFEPGVPPRGLTLVESHKDSTGVLINTYRPAGPLQKGSHIQEPPSEPELARRKRWQKDS